MKENTIFMYIDKISFKYKILLSKIYKMWYFSRKTLFFKEKQFLYVSNNWNLHIP